MENKDKNAEYVKETVLNKLPTSFYIPKPFNTVLVKSPLRTSDIELDDRFYACTIPGTYEVLDVKEDEIVYVNIDKLQRVVLIGTAVAFLEAINRGFILPRGTWGMSQY